MAPNIPNRPNYWNVPLWAHWVLYLTETIAVIIMFYQFYQRYRLWRVGQPVMRTDHPLKRVGLVLKYALGQWKLLREKMGGMLHFGIFFGFTMLLIGTILATIDTDLAEPFHFRVLIGNFYLFYEFILDLFAVFFLIGLTIATYRRYKLKPPQLSYGKRFDWALIILWIIILTGLIVEALRLAATHPAWAGWSFAGWVFAQPIWNVSPATLQHWHIAFWFVHFILVAGFFITLPDSILGHTLIAPLNIYFGDLEPMGAMLKPIPNLEEAEELGVNRIDQFNWRQLLSLDACTECGRCLAVCPAATVGEPLSPKGIITSLRDHMTSVAPSLLTLVDRAGQDSDGSDTELPPLLGNVIDPAAVWSCTTCGACVYECPVLVEHVPLIVEMRRYLTLMEGNVPDTVGNTLMVLERNGNPWGFSPSDRANWTKELDFEIPIMADKQEVDVLWWVGCAGSYDPRNQKVSKALAKIMHAAGVDFAILGTEERCSGDTARRSGNEWLFQTMAEDNIATLKQYKFKRIVVQCPHCFNTIKNEYPQFGGEFEVIHHSQFISELIAQNKIELKRTAHQKVTFHDPCYLGRYNGEYDAPRFVVQATGAELVEPERTRDKAMCCGGGGARVWQEDQKEVRINYTRFDQLAETGAEEIGVGCPFCMIMLEDAAKTKADGHEIPVRDIAEIVADSL